MLWWHKTIARQFIHQPEYWIHLDTTNSETPFTVKQKSTHGSPLSIGQLLPNEDNITEQKSTEIYKDKESKDKNLTLIILG